MLPLLEDAAGNVSADNWKKAIFHTCKIEKRMLELDNIMELRVEPLILNFNGDTSSSSEFDLFEQEYNLIYFLINKIFMFQASLE